MYAAKVENTITHKESPQAFVDRLIDEGSTICCDDSNESFKSNFDQPKFYDEDLFKRGQQFFHKHMYGMFFSKLLGLIVILSVPTILKILIMTKMSSTSTTAYRRYVATILHMMMWYDKDFKPGSDLWNSIAEVRRLHNSASKRGKQCSLNNISQMDMALTQFGFMGFAVCRSQKVGIHKATEEEWAGFIHVWRVIGHMMGIEDRFNICRESVEETRQITNLLACQVYKPLMENGDSDFREMAANLLEGMWYFYPLLNHESLLNCAYALLSCNNATDKVKDDYLPLKGFKKRHFLAINWMMNKLQYDWFRIFHNYTMYLMMWICRRLPILAVVSFGTSSSYIKLRLLHALDL